ncbi:serine/threonine-protein kinase [Bremerella sp. JC770]|uniref:serine/threonine protein kinase n=1 Tax=Bremerella sp. JC770 TaxID=3232137 RepID=UPI003457CB39
MSDSFDLDSLPAEAQSQVEECCTAFETKWLAGETPSLTETLASLPEALRRPLLRELIEIERYYRSGSRKQPLSLEELVQLHPELSTDLASLWQASLKTQALSEGDTRSQFDDNTVNTTGSLPGFPFQQLPAEFGRYRILQSLGVGGMGSVYLAEDTQLARQVAIKLPQISDDSDPQWVTRFYREAKAAANLTHRYVCSVYDVDILDGIHYLSMEYIPGDTLANQLKTGKVFSNREAALLIMRVASAMEVAHAQGIIHRDLKPANLMIRPDDSPVITDFGLAQISQVDPEESQITQRGQILGSPSYMSPEQVQADPENIGPATDIYSLGVMFYELLTGQRPFQGAPSAVFAQILSTEPAPIHQLREQADPQLSKICRTMMCRSLEDRYPSMKAVVTELEAWLKKDAATAEPASSSILPPRRWLTAAGFAAVLIAFLLVVLVIRTPEGEVRVTVNDASVSVLIDNRRLELTDMKWNGKDSIGPHQLSVMVGDQTLPIGQTTEVEIDGDRREVRLEVSGIHLTGNQFQITRGDPQKVVVDIQWVSDRTKRPMVDSVNPPPGSPKLDEELAKWVIEQGGMVVGKPYAGGDKWRTTNAAEFPAPPYGLVEFNLFDAPDRFVDAATLQRIEQLPMLDGANISASLSPKEAWNGFRFPPTITQLNVCWSNVTSSKFKTMTGLEGLAVIELHHRQVDDDWEFLRGFPEVRSLRIERCLPGVLTELRKSKAFQDSNICVVTLASRSLPNEQEVQALQAQYPDLTIVGISSGKPQFLGEPVYLQAANELLDEGIQIYGLLRKGPVNFTKDNRPSPDEAFKVNIVRFPEGMKITPEIVQKVNRLPVFQVLQARGIVGADRLAGADCLRTCSGLHFQQSDLSDTGFQSVCDMTSTAYISVRDTQVTQQAIAHEHLRNPIRVMEIESEILRPAWDTKTQ